MKRRSGDGLLGYALAKPGAWEDHPWEDHPVAKVGDKIFLFVSDNTIGVKSGRTRAEADEWLHRFPHDASVMPYLGRYGWNSLRFGAGIPDDELCAAIDESYDDVVGRLPRSRQPR